MTLHSSPIITVGIRVLLALGMVHYSRLRVADSYAMRRTKSPLGELAPTGGWNCSFAAATDTATTPSVLGACIQVVDGQTSRAMQITYPSRPASSVAAFFGAIQGDERAQQEVVVYLYDSQRYYTEHWDSTEQQWTTRVAHVDESGSSATPSPGCDSSCPIGAQMSFSIPNYPFVGGSVAEATHCCIRRLQPLRSFVH